MTVTCICNSFSVICYLQLKEKEDDQLAAINLYLKAGLPARAARVVTSREVNSLYSVIIQ